eukprot:Pgem_evm1s10532
MASAHGQMTVPSPRPDLNGRPNSSAQDQPVYTLNGPTTADYGNPTFTKESYRCHGLETKSSNQQTLTAGQDFTIEVDMAANHPGDCFLYLSDPAQAGQISPSRWYKIWELPGCGSATGLGPDPKKQQHTFKVPDGAPACENCVLRWEWYSVQQVSNVEFYVNCADVNVVNPFGNSQVESGMVTIGVQSGIEHLPPNAEAYRKAYNGEHGPQYLVGPKLASFSLNGGSPVNTQAPAPTQTPASTQVPVTTQNPAPTQAPSPGNCGNSGYSQCGGKGFTGCTSCPDNFACKYDNEWWSMCAPSTNDDPAPPSPPATTTATAAQPTGECENAMDAAVVHHSCSMDGNNASFGPGSYNKQQIQNMIGGIGISRIVLKEGYSVTLFQYDNFQGKYFHLRESSKCYSEMFLSQEFQSIEIARHF